LLKVITWIHRFYFSSLGEAIQAVLPSGMNFVSEPRIKVIQPDLVPKLRGLEEKVYSFVVDHSSTDGISLSEVSNFWKQSGERAIQRLIKKKLLEIWHIPRLKTAPATVSVYEWSDTVRTIVKKEGWVSVWKDHVPASVLKKLEYMFSDSSDEHKESSGKLPKWIQGGLRLIQADMPATKSRLMEQAGLTEYIWKKIRETGLLSSQNVEKAPEESGLPYNPDKINQLNEEQQAVVEPVLKALHEHSYKRFLLFGITGSGKTEVYIHALKEALSLGKGGLVLVPEIALTPQTVRRFYLIFGDQIAVLHSRLSDRERLQAWSALQKGEKKIAIGPRSAVFAPIQNPGIIIMDEEHDPSYKQEDPAPRYHARETAVMRAYYNNAVIITGSATPSLTSLQAVRSGKCELLRLENRHALSRLPEVQVLDLKEYRYAMRGPLAVPLYLAIEEALKKKEQVILLHNRRGFSPFVQCNDCGEIPECPHCSMSLTYHKIKHLLRCHYCGYSKKKGAPCAACNSPNTEDMGSGTQRIEESLATLFPEASILRMDQDSTSGKGAHDTLLQAFANREADILMGTQIVAKGLDFPNVTVVGVINSDTELAFPSYRSSERMYQLLSQVSGRSGRGSQPGFVYLQTRIPDHFTFLYTKKHDFSGFAKHELKSRKALNYPPFSRLVKVLFRSPNEQLTAQTAEFYTQILHQLLPPERIIGPAPSTITRIKNHFCWETHLKLPVENGAGYMDRLFSKTFELFEKSRHASMHSVRITVNIDTMN
ncbi:primosomal protein N', partial [Balneolaceae bacterium ANBcel3]|nr:primosomal protein N' [Balneolaceae bacterium ANBcel3]